MNIRGRFVDNKSQNLRYSMHSYTYMCGLPPEMYHVEVFQFVSKTHTYVYIYMYMYVVWKLF